MTETVTAETPDDFEVSYEDGTLTVEGNGEEVSKKMEHALIDVETGESEVTFTAKSSRKNVVSILNTYKSHVQNLVDGLQEPHVYKMKGVYAHFPMTIKEQNNQVVIENFMGERKPRTADIIEGVTVEVDGEDLTISGADKDAVSQTAARIEQLCKKGDRDPRTFQDGVYITEADTNDQ